MINFAPLVGRHIAVSFATAGFALACFVSPVCGQVGNDNPTGPSGMFNGNITTGGSYDPYTANATRTITDLVVTGAVGEYGLSFSRTSNSRRTDSAFGMAGGWQHPFAWSIDPVEDLPSGQPIPYTVNFPDGRVENFGPVNQQNGYWRSASSGVSERLKPWDGTFCYLLLPDGGKVQFRVYWNSYVDGETHQTYYNFWFNAEALIDPYGLRTTFSTNPDGSFQITEPAGRWIKVFYTSVSNTSVIDHIQGSDGREVHYGYQTRVTATQSYVLLTSVVYYGDNSLTAMYDYQQPNVGDPNGLPLLSTCYDPMYAGPLKRISYTYATADNPDGSVAVYGQLLWENNGVNNQAVSRLTVDSFNGRTETRGDGPSRTFSYSDGKIVNYTDFQGHGSSVAYDGNGFTWAFTDARGKTTTTLREGIIGALSVLTHPDPEQSTQGYAYKTVDGAPYFVQILGDEAGRNTYFTRDPTTNRVTKIWYPDYDPNDPNADPTEEFTYNGFGQVLTHTMTSGGVENYRYDTRGLKTLSWPPPTPSDPNPEQHPTQFFYYTSGPQMDRLWYVIDPRGYSTRFEYNTRGQTTKITHDQDGTYAQYGYNPDGTLAWAADENHPNASWNANERTRYTYDDCKRVVSITNPMNETTTLSYAPSNGTGSYAHTANAVYRLTSPLNKVVALDYDENFRRKMVRRGVDSSDDDGGTYIGYDGVGNLTSAQDPRGNVTHFAYDGRNRRTSGTAPVPFNDQITRWEYDTRSNLTKETRPDGSYRRMEYDSLSRVRDTYSFANEHTHYERDHAGNILQLVDPKPATYFFVYDKLNRKTDATYPIDATPTVRGESWHYDFAGNVDQYLNPAGQTKRLGYDTRNRFINSSWDGGVGAAIGVGYDDASRLRIIVTDTDATTVVFGYDDANRKIWEEQTVSGFPTRRVETPQDSDGFRTSLSVPGWYTLSYDYTKRGQLANIYGGGPVAWFGYSYDAAGNMTRRQDVLGGVNDSTNVLDAAGVSQYDALNRPTLWEQTGAGNAAFARSHFSYDVLGRLTASWRDEQASKGEWFGYNPTGEITAVSYNADQVSSGNPQNATRSVNYTITPDTLNRTRMLDNGHWTTYAPNAMNQYASMNGGSITYDGNFNLMALGGSSFTYDADNRLVDATSGEDGGDFTYDGLGRCLKRTIDGVTTLIAYDGWKPVVEWDEWGNSQAWNVYGAGPDEILYRHDVTRGDMRYHLDQTGNVMFLLDSDGDGIEKYTYDAFGKPTVSDWNGANPRSWSYYGNRFMFQGREWISELGIYDFRNRFYHPTLGRFLQKDPTGFDAGDANLFRYCGGDSINLKDPLGLDVVITLQEATGLARGFDHIGLGVNSTDTQGFYGSNSFNSQGMIGQIKSDNPTSDEILGSITITTTPAQDAIIAGVFAQFNGTHYDFFDRNCATAIAAALQAAGLKFDSSNIPYALFINLTKAYPPGHGSRVTYPNGVKGGPYGNGNGGGGGGESPSGGSSPGVSVIPSIQIGGYYNVDPNSDFFRNLMAAYPNATVVQQSGPFGGGGKNVPIFILF